MKQSSQTYLEEQCQHHPSDTNEQQLSFARGIDELNEKQCNHVNEECGNEDACLPGAEISDTWCEKQVSQDAVTGFACYDD